MTIYGHQTARDGAKHVFPSTINIQGPVAKFDTFQIFSQNVHKSVIFSTIFDLNKTFFLTSHTICLQIDINFQNLNQNGLITNLLNFQFGPKFWLMS